ncbi:hypothetical protein [Winogradskyella aurantia]|uniref:Uncharacterized protein n=1 Tax=Winogradskyella aurantia TaxID=1915063 RepID=A0A265UZW4_9FLAO|nr:hypothetical protein [Winogradskyella aurantia]OZV70607.1 hypothetical protein CA834_00380 [Winogradskyella aurantia]
MKLIATALFIFIFSSIVFSQAKDEREERITLKEFPEPAISLIKNLPKNCKKFKFYRETDGTHKSFEAKFKYKKHLYSIEFNLKGIVEDIEQNIKFKEIDHDIKSKISNYFDGNFSKVKIIKTQKQYLLIPDIDHSTQTRDILTKEDKSHTNYEIIAEVQTNNKREFREFTFSGSGEIIAFRILNATSYEHVLY